METTMTWFWRHLVFVANLWSSGTSSTFLHLVVNARLTTASIALAIQQVQAWLHQRTCTTRPSHVIQVPYSRWTTKPLVRTFFNTWVSSWLSTTLTETTVYVASKSPSLFQLYLTFLSSRHQVLPYAIKRLQAAGYRLVTLAECLGQAPYQSVGTPSAPDVSTCTFFRDPCVLITSAASTGKLALLRFLWLQMDLSLISWTLNGT